ncbi:hypothetical protein CU254_39585 [Amycolatopsis sp. AA4]|uniref:hypothetical protein n=1 Tax=Actinomycetes TaxID=1760 RepID=UPI0001B57BAE|nr:MULTISPECIES: hypothetical protein [Actinomycetes]ATY15807.1 hypothetical protein CU254_39585 [Amycolatopsis sp. AA4]EFL12125.1 predicted protein [Streptomyces sp. AA4]
MHNEVGSVDGGSLVQAQYIGTLNQQLPGPERVVPHETPRAVRRLVGREKQIEACLKAQRVPLFVFDGLTGAGRRALARYVAEHVKDRYPGGAYYTDYATHTVDGEAVIPAALRSLLRRDGVRDEVMPAEPGLASLWRSRSSGAPGVLLLENVTESEQFLQLMPGGRDWLVLVAGRVESRLAVDDFDGKLIKVKPLDDKQAAELFRELSGLDAETDDPVLAEVLGYCGGLPLALRNAATLVVVGRCPSLPELAARLRRSRAELMRSDRGPNKGDPVFEATYQEATRPAQRAYRLLGAYPAIDFPAPVFALLLGLDEATSRDILAELVLLKVLQEERGRYSMHPLVHDHAASLSGLGDEETCEALARVVRGFRDAAYYADAAMIGVERYRVADAPEIADPFTDDRRANGLGWFEENRRALHELLPVAKQIGLVDEIWQIAESLAAYYFDRKRHADSLSSLRHGIEAAEEAGNRAAEARLRSLASRPLTDSGQFEQAGDFVRRSIELADEDGHLVLRASVREFAGRYHDLTDQPELARQRYRESIELNEAAGEKRGEALSRMFLGQSLRDAEGLRELDAAHRAFGELGDGRSAARAMLITGQVRVRSGLPGGVEALTAAAEAFQKSGATFYEAQARESLHAALVEGNPAEARRNLERAIQLYRELGSPRAEELSENDGGLEGAES